MDGTSLDAGAVAELQDVKHAITAARLVLDHTEHTCLAGEAAGRFAARMGMVQQDLTTPRSAAQYRGWCAAVAEAEPEGGGAACLGRVHGVRWGARQPRGDPGALLVSAGPVPAGAASRLCRVLLPHASPNWAPPPAG
jgi:hypothetical protein